MEIGPWVVAKLWTADVCKWSIAIDLFLCAPGCGYAIMQSFRIQFATKWCSISPSSIQCLETLIYESILEMQLSVPSAFCLPRSPARLSLRNSPGDSSKGRSHFSGLMTTRMFADALFNIHTRHNCSFTQNFSNLPDKHWFVDIC